MELQPPISSRYYLSDHFRDDPCEEVNAALAANPMESIKATLTGRMAVEIWQKRPDIDAIERVQQQLKHLVNISNEVQVIDLPNEVQSAA